MTSYMKEQHIVGVVYPVGQDHVNRIFDSNKNVFLKYTPWIPSRPDDYRLKRGMKILFYLSHSKRRIFGEGRIRNLEFLKPKEALAKYGSSLILSEKEITAYAKQQPNRTLEKPLLVLVLDNLKKYSQAIHYHRNVAMAGEFLMLDTYQTLLQQSASP